MEISECTNIGNINIINEVMLRRLGHVRSMDRNSLETEMKWTPPGKGEPWKKKLSWLRRSGMNWNELGVGIPRPC